MWLVGRERYFECVWRLRQHFLFHSVDRHIIIQYVLWKLHLGRILVRIKFVCSCQANFIFNVVLFKSRTDELAIIWLHVSLEIQVFKMHQSVQIKVRAECAGYDCRKVHRLLGSSPFELDQVNCVLVETWWNENTLLDQIRDTLVLQKLLLEHGQLLVERFGVGTGAGAWTT